MRLRTGHALAYPVLVTIGTLAITLAWVPFADPEQNAMLGTLTLIVLGYSGFRIAMAYGYVPNGITGEVHADVRRVRQQHRLESRSWLEFGVDGRNRWLPVYFDPELVRSAQAAGELSGRAVCFDGLRLYPAGRVRDSEPDGRLVDNPSRPDPAAGTRTGTGRRLLFDAQSAVAAPFAALLWVYVAGGGIPAFAAATIIAAALATWLAAIRGSDPS